jgi:hypothetical protein
MHAAGRGYRNGQRLFGPVFRDDRSARHEAMAGSVTEATKVGEFAEPGAAAEVPVPP